MSLNELLSKYKQLPIVERILYINESDVGLYINVRKKVKDEKKTYLIEPTNEFLRLTGAISTKLYLDGKLNIIKSECGCLEYYRKKECVHSTLLYALAILKLKPDVFYTELETYRLSKLAEEQAVVLNKLANDLRTNSSYFNKLHLAIEIINDGDTQLALHISYDKEYVVKSISEFIFNMENYRFYSYGQKLSFIHSYEVLDDVSKEFYSFLLNIVNGDCEKTIKIKKGHILKLLEIYHDYGIYYTDASNKTKYYPIVDVDNIGVKLNDKQLYIDKPYGSKELICGVNYAYFIGEDKIYAYKFKKRNETLIIDALFKVNEGLIINYNSTDFISNLLPVIKSEVVIEESFYEKHSLPNVSIKSYFVYQGGKIELREEVFVEEIYENTPYVSQILDGYYKSIEGLGFIKNKDDVYYIKNVEDQYLFITSDLSVLKSFGEVFFDDSIKKITLKKSSRVKVSVSYNIGLLDFKLDSGVMSIEEVQAMLLAYHQKKKFVKLKNDVILEIKEEDVKELDNFMEDFNISIEELKKPVLKPLNYILKLVGAKDESLITYDDEVVDMISKIENFKESNKLPSKEFDGKLRNYQEDAFKWLTTLADFGFGGILADDMGLGKTLEILSFVVSDKVLAPTIIVCPMSLVYNWENECKKWNLDISTNLILGGALEREEIIKNINYNKKSIYITSYDSLRRDIEFYDGVFRFVIADEAQYIKNQNALKSTAIKKLKSQMNFALTGTPIENGLADLWSIFDYLMPGYLADYNHFKSRYESLIVHDDDEALDLLKKRIQPFILRRTKKDVLSELPSKTEQIYYCKMDPKQKEVYDGYVGKLKDDLKNGGNQILSLIMRLRQICISPELIYEEEFVSSKLSLCLELIKRAISGKHRILLFSQFASVFPIISKLLDNEGIKYFTLDGHTKANERLELVDEFNKNEEIKVFMISLKAGGTGLNLVGADMVIHLDPWWNVSAENQATDRAHRIGQTRNVHVLKLVCKDTIEEKVLLLQKAKQELANSVISSDANKKIKLTKEDILQMLE